MVQAVLHQAISCWISFQPAELLTPHHRVMLC
jgi:hypothetical protein